MIENENKQIKFGRKMIIFCQYAYISEKHACSKHFINAHKIHHHVCVASACPQVGENNSFFLAAAAWYTASAIILMISLAQRALIKYIESL